MNLAYEDAEAYAQWARNRLPTEAEREFAARGGLSGKPFVWGDEFRPREHWMASTFQGRFPILDTGDDGHVGITEVGIHPANGYGLYDMAGNAWVAHLIPAANHERFLIKASFKSRRAAGMPDAHPVTADESLVEEISRYGLRKATCTTGLDRKTIRAILHGEKVKTSTLAKILVGLQSERD